MIYTIGHSTRTAEELLTLLHEHGVTLLFDVRRYPGSKRYPHFAKDQLPAWLEPAGIEYRHAEALGGRRAARNDSANTAWRNPQFRGYADHLVTPQFRAALDEVIACAGSRSVALMCAEAVPWRCHRQLIADALVARGIPVRHIIAPGTADLHALNPMARVRADGTVTYPGSAPQLELLD